MIATTVQGHKRTGCWTRDAECRLNSNRYNQAFASVFRRALQLRWKNFVIDIPPSRTVPHLLEHDIGLLSLLSVPRDQPHPMKASRDTSWIPTYVLIPNAVHPLDPISQSSFRFAKLVFTRLRHLK